MHQLGQSAVSFFNKNKAFSSLVTKVSSERRQCLRGLTPPCSFWEHHRSEGQGLPRVRRTALSEQILFTVTDVSWQELVRHPVGLTYKSLKCQQWFVQVWKWPVNLRSRIGAKIARWACPNVTLTSRSDPVCACLPHLARAHRAIFTVNWVKRQHSMREGNWLQVSRSNCVSVTFCSRVWWEQSEVGLLFKNLGVCGFGASITQSSRRSGRGRSLFEYCKNACEA